MSTVAQRSQRALSTPDQRRRALAIYRQQNPGADEATFLVAYVMGTWSLRPIVDAARALVHGSAGGWRPELFDALEAAVTQWESRQP